MRVKKIMSMLMLATSIFAYVESNMAFASRGLEIPLPTRNAQTHHTKPTNEPVTLPSFDKTFANIGYSKEINDYSVLQNRLTCNDSLTEENSDTISLTEEIVFEPKEKVSIKRVGRKQIHSVPLDAKCSHCGGTNLQTSGKTKAGLKIICLNPNCTQFKRDFIYGVKKHTIKAMKARCIPCELGKKHPCPRCGCQNIKSAKINGYSRLMCANAVCRKVFTAGAKYKLLKLPYCPSCGLNNTFILNPNATIERKAYCYNCGEKARLQQSITNTKNKQENINSWLEHGTFIF